MGKPRAARKQPVVLSSDTEDDGQYSPPPKRPKKGTLISVSQNGASKPSKLQSHGASPSKPQKSRPTAKSPTKSPAKPKPIYKPITSFFSNVVPPPTTKPTPSPEKPAASTPVEESDEILDSSDGDHPPKRPAPPIARKRGREGSGAELDGGLKGSQRFFKTINGARSTPPSSTLTREDTADRRPWNEKYGPVTLDELAVHKKKVADVRNWLSDVLKGTSRKRLLLLKGPAGSGKTTTMSLLSKDLGFDMHEWKNPSVTGSSEGFISMTAQFEDFVGRTGAFGSLAFDAPVPTLQSRPTSSESDKSRQLILVEEFPNTFARASSAVQSFRTSILNYLAANTPSATAFFAGKASLDQSVTPIVMIVSETLLSTNTAAADSFTAHRLLGPEILTHPGVSVIEFNPIAPTFMTKALDLVVLKEARKSGRKRSAGPQVIQRLSELGDVRSAVSSLEFLCIRGDEDGDWGGQITFAKKKSNKDAPMTKMERESLEMVTQREHTLGIFHAVGRVVHNKRIPEDPHGTPTPQPPNWFPERRRPKVSETNVDALIDELGTDTQTFIASLHENYVLSCQGADSEETMDSIDGCIDALSDADLLSADRFGSSSFGRRNFSGTSADNLRQDEMSFQVSVRGLLYSLPSPVKRIMPPPGIMGAKGAAKGNAFVMYYPASLRIWRQQEELGGLLDLWTSRIQKGELLPQGDVPSKPTSSSNGSVETWARSAPFAAGETSGSNSKGSDASEASPPVLLGSGGSARNELLLERLPYLTRILRKGPVPAPSTAATIREIRKLTSFTGHNMSTSPDDQDDEDDESAEQDQWSTDRPESPKKKRKINKIGVKKSAEAEALAGIVEKDVKNLVLSDDDIED